MRKLCVGLLALTFVIYGCSGSKDTQVSPEAAADQKPSESADFLAKVAGVYKEQSQNTLVSGEKYQSENTLEIVPIDDHAAFVKMNLEFANGHSGVIFGVAKYVDHSLVYDNDRSGNEHCVVTFVWASDSVRSKADYQETPGCSNYHGARGLLDGANFSTDKKKEIGYLQKLKDSAEFKEAIEEYRN